MAGRRAPTQPAPIRGRESGIGGTFQVSFSGGRSASAVVIEQEDDLECAAREFGLAHAPACIVVIGGADGMSENELAGADPIFRGGLVPEAQRRRAIVLDGGTDSGVMSLLGHARAAQQASFPLVGVVVDRLAVIPPKVADDGIAELEPNHSHFVLVPGSTWGDEAPYLSALAAAVAAPSLSVLVNGGEVAWRDAFLSIERQRPLIAVDGTGRTANQLAAAARGNAADRRAEALAASGLVRAVDANDLEGLVTLVDELLASEG